MRGIRLEYLRAIIGICMLATVHCRDDLQKWSFGHSKLSSDEARKIAKAITRIPAFMMQRRGFYLRGQGNYRWKPAQPYHVAFEDGYIRAHWHVFSEMSRLNGIPFDSTGEKIQRGGLWCVYEFGQQFDAMMMWNRFEGRWLRDEEFSYPERPENIPTMKEVAPVKSWNTKPPDLRR
ncbi:hypothetical protein XI04_08995 [Bradyrhizobium sp. CCBAU 11430]|nr:hypothetical protein [Bradyrhizobium sp. CCBAU 11430]